MFKKLNTGKQKEDWFIIAFFFLLAFIYFFFFASHILFFQEQQYLFVYTSSYFQEFFIRPGGLLDLSGKFLTQFYYSRLAGSLILAITLTLPGIILMHINRRLISGPILNAPLMIIPSCLLLLMQTHYYHMMMYNLGFLLILFYFLLFVLSKKRVMRIILTTLFPFFFYFAGAYALIFALLFLTYSFLYLKGPEKYYLPIILIFEVLVSAIIFKQILLLQGYMQLALFPLPFINDQTHKILFYILTAFIILYPAICMLSGRIKLSGQRLVAVRRISVVIVPFITLIMLITGYNSQNARVINLEKLVFNEKWKEAIKYQEKHPSENRIGQYFYNIALSETDQLCDRLFYGPQDFGTGSLMLEWSGEHLNWGSFAFYTTGLINEAQRWAYEEMVVYGRRPQNMKMLIKTSLLTANYRLAEKYSGILNNTLFYKTWSERYGMMAEDTSLIRLDPELGEKRLLLPKSDFFIYLESPEQNLPLLVDENPQNRKAFEYMMSWLMLGKEVEILVNNIRLMKKMGYTTIPRHIEEAIMIYYNSQHKFPDMGGLTISKETRMRFDQYFSAYVTARQNPATLKEKMKEQFSNTFWYYFHFTK